MRGRLPSGPKYVEQLPGSDLAKQRLQVILETMAGTCRVQEACAKLGISEPRFHQLRLQMLEAAMHSMEPGSPGRPPRKTSLSPEQLQQLQEQLAQKEIELRAAQLRTEIALVLPQVALGPQRQSDVTPRHGAEDCQQPAEQQREIDATVADGDAEKKTSQRPTAASKPSRQPPPHKRMRT